MNDKYGSKKEKYYNRNGIKTREVVKHRLEKDLIDRERDIQTQWQDRKTRDG